MTRCPKSYDRDGNDILNEKGEPVCKGEVFTQEYGEPRCTNAMCDWNIYKRRIMWESDV